MDEKKDAAKMKEVVEKKKGICGKCPFGMGFPICICCILVLIVIIWLVVRLF